ncbi:MAG: helicase-related protein [Hyphomicrobiaceae bacterium]
MSSTSPSVHPSRSRNVTAVLGPTNTGKTHLAIERMLGHQTGMIGLPLRLLAREVYDKIVARVGADAVALITGEEKIKPASPRFYVSTVEAMPRDVEVDFLAIDEVQLAADPERGHVFTDRVFHARGTQETLLLGAGTMREAIKELLPGANFVSRPRLSKLTYSGQKKISRLPRRTAIVAFSAAEVYEIAELIRRQRGGAAVVLGALSPRTRNAQVALYQSGDVEYIVATDAIGMGLNLDLDHVAFSATRKFDGRVHRNLTPAEIGQIAGRAGRHMNDGSFGVTGDAEPFDPEIIDRLEKHEFDPVKTLQWRNSALDFSSIGKLKESLKTYPSNPRLVRARTADDLMALETVTKDPIVADLARSSDAVSRLWDVCQLPDYRKISATSHAELIGTLFTHLMQKGRLPEDWFAEQVLRSNRTDGDLDTLSTRIAHTRTWTFVANRADWLADPEHWRQQTREIEDKLSDALHEQLTQRFVDKRTSVLMRRLRDDDDLAANVAEDGKITVEEHFVGQVKGFTYQPDLTADGVQEKAARNAAQPAVAREMAMRTRRVASAKSDAFSLARNARVIWRGEEIARLEKSDDPLRPTLVLIADESLQPGDRERVQQRLDTWLDEHLNEKLKPLIELSKAEDVAGLARGIAFRLKEGFGILKRDTIAEEIKQLDQEARAQLRKYGVRFGAFNIHFPLMLKPASSELLLLLWAIWNGEREGQGLEGHPEPPRRGLTSVPAQASVPDTFYRVAGYHHCGPRAVRVDMLERLADMIRPLIAWRPNEASPTSPPKGASGDGGFTILPEMMSILGCNQAELGEVLKALGFRLDRKLAPPKPVAVSTEAAAPAEAAVESETATEAAPAETESAADATPTTTEASVVETSPAEAASGETSAVEAPASDASAAEAPAPAAAEPEYIEIWRPRRRYEEGRREHQQRGRHRPHHRPAAASGEASAAATESAPSDAAAGEAPSAERPDRERRHRHGKPRHERHRDRDWQGPRPDRGAAVASDASPRQDRPDRDRNRDRDRGPRRHERPREEKRAVFDPNSPFAALSALKEKLEADRKPGSSS